MHVLCCVCNAFQVAQGRIRSRVNLLQKTSQCAVQYDSTRCVQIHPTHRARGHTWTLATNGSFGDCGAAKVAAGTWPDRSGVLIQQQGAFCNGPKAIMTTTLFLLAAHFGFTSGSPSTDIPHLASNRPRAKNSRFQK